LYTFASIARKATLKKKNKKKRERESYHTVNAMRTYQRCESVPRVETVRVNRENEP